MKPARSKNLTRFAAFLGIFFALIIWDRVTNRWVACHHPWVFFDLGDTLIDVKSRKGKDVQYLPGAAEYLADLRSKGYHIGLITNVPENWGPDHRTKVQVLKKGTPADVESLRTFETYGLGRFR